MCPSRNYGHRDVSTMKSKKSKKDFNFVHDQVMVQMVKLEVILFFSSNIQHVAIRQ